jgi:hypothetical protein
MRRRTLLASGAAALVPGGILATPGVALASTDYGPAAWVPAHSANFTVANRESSHNIQYVVIHTTQGSYNGTISWIQNPASQVSAHYVVKSSNGAVTQMVREKDIAWHAGNWTYNTQSIGIEHEGFVAQDGWYTEALYQSSAAIVRSVCAKYAIPRDRAHIIAHSEVPGATHTDPGPRWNWSYFMSLVNQTTPPPSWTSTVDNTTAGRSEAWYPALPGYNTAAPYIMATTTGNQVVYVDQRSGGGAWRNLGTFTFAGGDYNAVAVSRWTSGTGLVIADAVKLTRV